MQMKLLNVLEHEFPSPHCSIAVLLLMHLLKTRKIIRDGSRTAATSKMKLFVIIVNGFQQNFEISKFCEIHRETHVPESLF